MLTTTALEDDIRASLLDDPRIPDPSEIAALAEDGVVTLRGTVGSFRQRRAAVSDARNADQDYDVRDELNVRLLDEWAREDADIRGIALQILMWDVEIPAEAIDVKVSEGWVTLKGTVTYQFESDAAFEDVASLYGVVGITNEIKVVDLAGGDGSLCGWRPATRAEPAPGCGPGCHTGANRYARRHAPHDNRRSAS
jgi:osmotically-inducible protein OsmY